MKIILNRIAFLFCCFFLLPAIAFSQSYFYRNPFIFLKHYTRYEIGYSVTVGTAEYSGPVSVYNFASGTGVYVKDTLTKRTISSVPGFGASFGIMLPVARIGKTASVGLNLHLLYNTYTYNGLNQVYDGQGNYKDLSGQNDVVATTTQTALPISLDIKIGADALAIYMRHLGISVGGGVMPQYNTTILDGGSGASTTQTNFIAMPFAMAEVSFYAFDLFRLRAYYTFGDYPLFSQSSAVTGTSGYTFTGKTNLIISLTCLPLSYKWAKIKKEWWNDFDTELPYR